MKVLILVAAHNEEVVIGTTVRSIFDHFSKNFKQDFRILIVDNGSIDKTTKVSNSLCEEYSDQKYGENSGRVFVLTSKEAGRGRAIRSALKKYPDYDYYCYTDADLPVSPLELEKMVVDANSRNLDILVGKRVGKRPFRRVLLTKALKLINRILWGLSVSDSQCGVRVFSKKSAEVAVNETSENGWFLDTELLVRANTKGLKIGEMEVFWHENRYKERASKVAFFKDSYKGVGMVYRLIKKEYGGIFFELSKLLLAGTIISVFYWYSYLYIAPKDFFTIERTNTIFCFLLFSSFIYGVVLLFASWSKNVPYRIFFIFFLLFSVLTLVPAFMSHPIGSQDTYWNISLSRGFTQFGENPYITSPNTLTKEANWPTDYKSWSDLTMVQGPLWVLILYPATFFCSSFNCALYFMKAMYLLSLIISVYVFNKILKISGAGNGLISKMVLISIFWNPFVINHVLIDGHSDIFVMLLIILGYYSFLKKNYTASVLAFFASALIKYTPSFLILLPIYYEIKEILINKDSNIRLKLYSKFAITLISLGLFFIVVISPFGLSFLKSKGLADEFLNRGGIVSFVDSPGSLLLKMLFKISASQIRMVSILLCLLSFFYLLTRGSVNKKVIIIPFIFLLAFSPWLQPWYFLWFFIFLIYDLDIIGNWLVSSFLILSVQVFPSSSFLFILFYFFIKKTQKIFTHNT